MATPIEEIKARLDIVDIVSEEVQLRRSGRSYSGFCPFHSNSRTPAFVVFPDSQTWRCFGACAEGGDIFSYVMKKQGWDFKEALTQLARRAGVTLEEATPEQKKRKAELDQRAELLEAAADYFHQLLLYAPQAEHARRYVADRGLKPETVAAFKLGFALESWDACRSHFLGQGYSEQELLDGGMLTENVERGTKYDRFRNRLIFPIRDVVGRTVGFGARTFDPDGIPKYLNSPQTALFDKSHLLYGLDMAKRHIREARQAVIVEGYMDVIMAWQGGFRNLVAQMGTALTNQQLGLLKRYTKRFVIALDADAAGVKATMRSLEVARNTLDREDDVRFNARGLIRHEGRLKADIRVLTMPEGEDPDSIIRQTPERWPQLVKKALPVVEYVITTLVADIDMHDPKAKTAVAEQVIPLIHDVENAVERDHYWQVLARTLQVDDRSLRQLRLPQKRRAQAQRPARSAPPPPPPPPDDFGLPLNAPEAGEDELMPTSTPLSLRATALRRRQLNFLWECLHEPALRGKVDRGLEEVGETAVAEEDFSAPEDRQLFQLLHLLETQTHSWEELLADQSNVLQNHIDYLRDSQPPPQVQREKLAEKLAMSVLDWRLERTQNTFNQIKHLSRSESEEARELYRLQMRELPSKIRLLHRAKAKFSSYARRRAEESNL